MRRNRILACLIIAILGLWLLAPRACAIEVSLEENKSEKGGIGYVDMHALFKLFPETQKAKLSFEDAMHQTEEQINLRRAEIIGMRAEIARLEAEKDFAQKASSGPLVGTPSPGQEIRIPGLNAAPNIPGATTTSVNTPLSVSSSSSTVKSTNVPPGVSFSSATAKSVKVPLGMSSSSATVVSPMAAKIQQLDQDITDKTKLLEAKEADFKVYEDQAEKSLLDLESRKTEILLGRIYGAIQEVSRSEGLSVVVDKSQILFGHQGVDLTEKVLKKLKSQSQ